MPFEKVKDLRLYHEVHGGGRRDYAAPPPRFGPGKIWRGIKSHLFLVEGFKVVTYDRRHFWNACK